MDQVAANRLSILYADVKKLYIIYDRIGIETLRNPYKTSGFVIFETRFRSGGRVYKGEAGTLLKMVPRQPLP